MRGGRSAACLLVPCRKLDNRVLSSQLQRQYRIPKVMPINEQMGLSQEADKRRNRKRWNRRGILDQQPFRWFGLVCKTAPQTGDLEDNLQWREEQEKQLVASL